jgi:hydrogenase-4 component E
MAGIPLYAQLINLLAAILLLLAFAMLTQRRVLSLVNLFALQGIALGTSTGSSGGST